jgi:hypothetical protein
MNRKNKWGKKNNKKQNIADLVEKVDLLVRRFDNATNSIYNYHNYFYPNCFQEIPDFIDCSDNYYHQRERRYCHQNDDEYYNGREMCPPFGYSCGEINNNIDEILNQDQQVIYSESEHFTNNIDVVNNKSIRREKNEENVIENNKIQFEEKNIENLDDIIKLGKEFEKFFFDVPENNWRHDDKIKKFSNFLCERLQTNESFDKYFDEYFGNGIDETTVIKKDDFYEVNGKRFSMNPIKIMGLINPLEKLNNMIGMKSVKHDIFNFIAHYLQNDEIDGMVNAAIYGKPGVGKTELGKILCEIYNTLEIVPSSRVRIVKAHELVGKFVGETRSKTKAILNECDGGILFIDEVYSLMSGSDSKCSYGKECIDTINQELSENRKKLVILVAGYEQDVDDNFFGINSGLNRRFPFRYKIDDYTKEEMKDIMIIKMKMMNLFLDDKLPEDYLLTIFCNFEYFENFGGDVENLLTFCKFSNNVRSLGKHPMVKNVLTKEDIEKGLKSFKSHKKDKKQNFIHMFYT